MYFVTYLLFTEIKSIIVYCALSLKLTNFMHNFHLYWKVEWPSVLTREDTHDTIFTRSFTIKVCKIPISSFKFKSSLQDQMTDKKKKKSFFTLIASSYWLCRQIFKFVCQNLFISSFLLHHLLVCKQALKTRWRCLEAQVFRFKNITMSTVELFYWKPSATASRKLCRFGDF